ncbi:hypothetical protein SAMN05216548_1078 [Faunimonas pinastri]|uniref:Uncharacterized protein n=1 Tax=Faunimonas pinastri TaxID=1855383 RepID=A0A1H9I740_9HYPH|nr:hypothetical protein [Faunimonas pinastri]SEQ70501.1 hypothetical protein SAMN05216548_1078 [Faunimonas pinastri]
MHRLSRVAAAALLLLACLVAPAFAGDGSPVTVPWGDLIVWLLVTFGGSFVALALALYHLVLKHLSVPLRTWLQQHNADQLIERMVGAGLNSVAGASRGKVLTAEIGNQVLAAALNYGFAQAPKRLASYFDQGHAGVAVAKAVYARLNMDEDASAPDFQAIVAQTAAAVSAR